MPVPLYACSNSDNRESVCHNCKVGKLEAGKAWSRRGDARVKKKCELAGNPSQPCACIGSRHCFSDHSGCM